MSEVKKSKKVSKEEKHKKLLETIDLKLTGESKKPAAESVETTATDISASTEKFTISSLLSRIEGNADEQEVSSNLSALKKQVFDLDQKSKLLHEPESSVKQDRADRKANYKVNKDDVAKWIPIIKRAREADHLDFTNSKQTGADDMRVNSISGSELKRNKIAQTIEQRLSEMNLKSEKQIKAKEIELLEKIDPKEAKRRLNEMHKQKVLMFQQEIKNKRISKIKSKLYHKIKKRQKQRADMKEYENMDEAMKQQEQEKLAEERAQERIGMRHKTKSKHIQQMLKYGDKKTYQQSLNDINHQRQALLKKVAALEGDIDSDDLNADDLDDKTARNQFISDLQNELKEGGEIDQDNLTGIKFIDDLNQSKSNNSREEARKLLAKLNAASGLDSDILSEDDLIASDDEEGQERKKLAKEKKRKAEVDLQEEQDAFEGRKIYKKDESAAGKDAARTELEIEMEEMKVEKRRGKLNALDIVKSHVKNIKEAAEEKEIEELNETKKQTTTPSSNQPKLLQQKGIEITSAPSIQEDALTSGLSVSQLKEKFKKNAQSEFSKKELEAFNIENKEQIYKDLSNFNIFVDDDNEEKFLGEKYEDYEKEVAAEKKNAPIQGWGSWVGAGIVAKNLPTPEELARQKAARIQLLKKQRADGTLDNVIINEHRNKLFNQHLVKELPHPYKNKEQFEYLNNAPLGSEWSSMRSHQNLIKPKIKTKAGVIIQPASAPKSYKSS